MNLPALAANCMNPRIKKVSIMCHLWKYVLGTMITGFTLFMGCPDAEAQLFRVGYGNASNRYYGNQYYGNGWNGGYRQQAVYGYDSGYNQPGWSGYRYQNGYTYGPNTYDRGRRGRYSRTQVQYGCVAYQQPVAACQTTGVVMAGYTTQVAACCVPQPACCTTTSTAAVVLAIPGQASEPTLATLPADDSQTVRRDDEQVSDR
ncbi:hypothetical protein Spb1_06940 [Planctopirus ephydatiae]|uniref:Uncharacterized protein n=2 Tax=Planctopirus ephydatiae TaxID=2528019 RepID=A0A518GJR8_9PLAN|nr:hypothetical protein Spb1_06940 [Planctopirus ephydatiae]